MNVCCVICCVCTIRLETIGGTPLSVLGLFGWFLWYSVFGLFPVSGYEVTSYVYCTYEYAWFGLGANVKYDNSDSSWSSCHTVYGQYMGVNFIVRKC